MLADTENPPLHVVDPVPIDAYQNDGQPSQRIDGVHTNQAEMDAKQTEIQEVFSQLDGLLEESSWRALTYEYEPEIVEDVLPEVGTGVMFGPSGVGKSFVAAELAARIARGLRVWGKDTEQCGVLYCAFEGHRGLMRRIHGMKESECLENLPFRLVKAPWLFSQEGHFDHFEAYLTRAAEEFEDDDNRLGLVIIDTITNAQAGTDSHSDKDVGAMLQRLDQIAQKLGLFILSIGHTGKDVSRGMVGSFIYRARSDAVIELRLDSDLESGEVNSRSVFIDKVKDGPMGYTAAAFDLETVEMTMTKPNGKPLTTCKVEWQDAEEVEAVAQAKSKIGANMIDIYNLLRKGNRTRSQIMSETGLGQNEAKKALSRMSAKGEIKKIGDRKTAVWTLTRVEKLKTHD